MFLGEKCKTRALWFLEKVPIFNCLFYFSLKSHRKAALKLVFLWVVTTSPIIISILLSDVGPSEGSIFSHIAILVGKSVSTTDQLIYVAAFLTPIMYIWVDRVMVAVNNEEDNDFNANFKKANKGLITGYSLIVWMSLLIIFVVALGYGAIKVDSKFFASTNLARFLESWSWYIYLFSIYCWYLSILDSQFDSSVEAIANMNKAEQSILESGFESRIGK